MYTDFSSAECRSKAAAKLDAAERGDATREQLLADAAGWLVLADHLDFIEVAMATARRRSLH
jgi:hypothetical protein